MDRIVDVSYDFADDRAVREFVDSCESSFLSQVDRCADKIVASGGLRFVALSGPSCSGKTTATARINAEFARRKIKAKTISIDDFYLDRKTLEKRALATGGSIDFDSPSTIYFEYLAKCIDGIKCGRKVMLPHYNFTKGSCDGFEEYDPSSDRFFIFEGIQAVYPEFTGLFSDEKLFSVYIRPSSSIRAGGELFESHEIRFARRLVRDYKYRNASPGYTFKLWSGVRENEKKYIIPYEGDVDVSIDSTMLYEPAIIKKQYISCLKEISFEEEYYKDAQRLIEEYRHIPSISEDFVPSDSIFREFIGYRKSKDE